MTVYDQDVVTRIVREPGIAPETLADQLGVSRRTLRDHIRRINESLDGIGRISYVRKRGGYVLEVENETAFAQWTERHQALIRDDASSTARRRADYLLNDLLLRSDWITLDALADVLYVSRASISGDLKRVEPVLDRYSLKLERRPRYGIRVTGPELARRLCLAEATVHRMAEGDGTDGAEGMFGRAFTPLLAAVSSCVDRVLEAESFSVNMLSYQNLLVHIAIAVLRIQNGHYVQVSTLPAAIAGTRERAVAERIAHEVSEQLEVELPQGEVSYIAIHLAGKRVLYEDQPDAEEGTIVTDEIWGIVERMLEVVYQTYRFDFRHDMELRMNLARHIVPLSVRLTYRMHLENPLLEDIKSRYPLPYAMAGEAATVLAEAFGYYPSEHELGYIAMAFALALERQKTGRAGSHILVVCASGLASARLLAYKIQQEFGTQLASIETCNVAQVPAQDFSKIDYVFTTVPIAASLPVPVREITLLLSDEDRELMQLVLSGRHPRDLSGFFPCELFFAHQRFADKQEAIAWLVERVRDARPSEIPENIEELIWERERMAPTSFGNDVALPHPMEAVTDDTLVAVVLLDAPIDWGTNEVRAIFLLLVTKRPNAHLDDFYSPVASLLNDGEAIARLVNDQTYTRLMNELRMR